MQPALGRWRPKEPKFKDILCYTAISRAIWAIKDYVLNTNRQIQFRVLEELPRGKWKREGSTLGSKVVLSLSTPEHGPDCGSLLWSHEKALQFQQPHSCLCSKLSIDSFPKLCSGLDKGVPSQIVLKLNPRRGSAGRGALLKGD